MHPIDNWYLQQEEPRKSYFQFLRQFILGMHPNIREEWKYGMPFFCYGKKMMAYLWFHKIYQQPYIGIVEGKALRHPDLLQEKRARMKILLLDPNKDIPVRKIKAIFKEVLKIYEAKS